MNQDLSPTDPRDKHKEFRGAVRSLFYAIVLVVAVRTFLFEPFHIPSGSMIPTLLIGDHLFVKKWVYGFSRYSMPFGWKIPYFSGRFFEMRTPQLGDIVVFRTPLNPSQDFVKRLIGLPGDTIQMKEGLLHINGQLAPLEYIGKYDTVLDDDDEPLDALEFTETLPNGVQHSIIKQIEFGEASQDNTPAFVVPEGQYFVMGDNRDGSEDSRAQRSITFVPQDYFIGTPAIIFFSTGSHAALWEVWRWLFQAHYSRIFKIPH